MCGFTGFWDLKAITSKETLLSLVQSMSDEIKDRGPDSAGNWVDEKVGLALSFRRLAILDLSNSGEQPMTSRSGRFTIAFNGEVFNFDDLRDELLKKGYSFRGHSDTEVMLAAFEEWGIFKACQKFIGMFAIALWDKNEKKLFLIRDRVGIKPLYYGIHQGVLFFGSQPKCFLKHPKFLKEVDREALCAYFRFNYVPAPLSIFKGIKKIMPGTINMFDMSGNQKEESYWSLQHVASQTKIKTDSHSVANELETLLKDAVKRRMIADVPIGAFLSGGIDSSLVVSLMQAQSQKPVKTFSIGFFEQEYDEAQFAAKVAACLGTEHHELYLDSAETQNIIPDIPEWCDEPFADVSQIPTYLVSKLARQHVTVSLSGDGGDELFAGYNRYIIGEKIWRWLRLMPVWMRHLGSSTLLGLKPKRMEEVSRLLPHRLRPRLLSDKLVKFADILTSQSSQIFYKRLVSQWENPESLLQDTQEPILYPWRDLGERQVPTHLNFIENMQFMDMLTYLPDDILTKVDRASMANGLEARVPLLDHRVVEFAWRLPLSTKIRQNKSKWLLRQILARYLPNQLIERPKMGFGVPVDRWLRGPLKPWAESLLSVSQLEAGGLVPAPILKRWQAHQSGQSNYQYSLWGVLMYQAWRQRWATGS